MLTTAQITLVDEENTITLATYLAKFLTAPLVLTFTGEIGVGKTSFIRALLRALGVSALIKSPTFSLIESYNCEKFQINHFDLYRLALPEELEYIGFREYFTNNTICCIEWPEKARDFFGKIDLKFSLSFLTIGRSLQIEANSDAGMRILSYIRRNF